MKSNNKHKNNIDAHMVQPKKYSSFSHSIWSQIE